MQSPKSKSATDAPAGRPFVMPRLADHPRYAAALAKANDLATQAAAVRNELAAVRSEMDAIHSAKEDSRASIRESNVQRAMNGQAPTLYASLQGALVSLVERERRAVELLDVLEVAYRLFATAELYPARRAAITELVEPAIKPVWAIAAHRTAIALVQYRKALAGLAAFRSAVEQADLAGVLDFDPEPFGLHQLDGLVTQRDSAAAHQVRGLVADGHLPATHPCLDGVAL